MTTIERVTTLEKELKEVKEYLFEHVVTPVQENEGKIKRRKKK